MNPYFPFVFLKSLRENNLKFFIRTNKPIQGKFLYLSYEDKRLLRKNTNINGCYKSPIYFSPQKTDYTSVFTLYECPDQICGNSKGKIQTNYTLATTGEPIFGSFTDYSVIKEFIFSLPWCSMVSFKCKEEGISNATSYPEWVNETGKNVWLLRDVRGLYFSLKDNKITLAEREYAIELMFEPYRKWPDNYYIDFPWLKCIPVIKEIQQKLCVKDKNAEENECKKFGNNWQALESGEKCSTLCYYSCEDNNKLNNTFSYGFKLEEGDDLLLGNNLTSLSGNVLLSSRQDGLYLLGKTPNGWVLFWRTMTGGGNLILTREGNLILHDKNKMLWQSETSGTNVRLVVQDDGMLEMFDGDEKIASTHLFGGNVKRLDGDVRYMSRKDPYQLQQLEELLPGEKMVSKDGSVILYNVGRSFVLVKNKHIIWNLTYNEPIVISVSPEGTLDIVGVDSSLILKSFGEKGELHRVLLEDGLVMKDKDDKIIFKIPISN